MADAVNTLHPLYSASLPLWSKCRDAVEGEDRIKAEKTKYLPKLTGQETEDYAAYLLRACWYNASSRTVEGLSGAVTRKPPQVEPAGLDELIESFGSQGESLEKFSGVLTKELLTTGRVGVLVDSSETPNAPPYACYYSAESIINWRVTEYEGEDILTLVVLHEVVEEAVGVFETKMVEQWRVLRFEVLEGESQPVYFVQIWRRSEGKEAGSTDSEFFVFSESRPAMKGGRKFERMPFAFANTSGIDPKILKPPILDLVNVNLSHYRNSADLEHGRHFTALPTPWVAGFDLKDTKLTIGSGVAWISDDPQAKAGYLEFSGAGLKSLADALTEKKQDMAVLGSRLLESQKADAEAAKTVELRQSGEQSILASIADAVGMLCSFAMTVLAQWNLARSDDAVVRLNKDFVASQLDPAQLTAWIEAVQGSQMSWDTFFHLCERHEVYPPGRTAEEERKLIEDGGPSRPPGQMDLFEAENAKKELDAKLGASQGGPPATNAKQPPAKPQR